ncbi:hypothetical protein IGK14_000480 [Enterococcus sp. DIV0970a]|nr:hypothetical protein UAM_01800 [Enterococcus casseliflavus ATCC 49996]EOU10004.1 hypothetical protein I582_00509 [Enterococcus casseliflavus ATCC 49996]
MIRASFFYKYAKQLLFSVSIEQITIVFYFFDHYLQFCYDVRLLFPKTFYKM